MRNVLKIDPPFWEICNRNDVMFAYVTQLHTQGKFYK